MDILLEFIPAWQFLVFAAVFGAMWGSFANVVIVRWPMEMSVVRPGSHCFSCKSPVKFYDNIPIVSYLLLRGKCRNCKTSFSPRYMIIELCMALLSMAVMQKTLLLEPMQTHPSFVYGLSAYFIWFAFVWALVTAAMIDLETFLLPDVITVTGIVVGLLANIFVLKTGWIDPVIGAVGGYAVLSLLFVHGYKLLTGHQGMGQGDPKLVGMLGAFLGWRGALFCLFAGAVQGLVVGTIMVIYNRKTGKGPIPLPLDDDEDEDLPDEDDQRFRKAMVPFGPFLVLGALEYLFLGDLIIDLYLGMFNSLLGL